MKTCKHFICGISNTSYCPIPMNKVEDLEYMCQIRTCYNCVFNNCDQCVNKSLKNCLAHKIKFNLQNICL